MIDRETLGRPRIDVVLQATGLYRDAFGESLKLLHAAATAVAKLQDEPDNPVAQMTRSLRSRLVEQGVDADTADSLSEARLFSSATGLYGSGVPDAVSAVDSWAQNGSVDEDAVGRVFLERFDHAYVGGEAGWSSAAGRVELFAEHLAVSEAAVLSRTSNLFGLLSTDDPFAYLGGLSAGIRAAGGGTASLYISNLRRSDSQRMEIASGFLSREVRTRFQNPKWIESMVAEGYAGTTRLQGTMENLWGWQATDRAMVRSDQWDRFHEVYVQDLYELGLTEWFEQQNPEARTRIMERMLDAVRTDFWEIDPARLEQLLTDYLEWIEIHGPGQVSEQRDQFVAETASGLGLGELLPSPEAAMSVVGQIMQPVADEPPPPLSIPREWLYALTMLSLILAGAIWQARRGN